MREHDFIIQRSPAAAGGHAHLEPMACTGPSLSGVLDILGAAGQDKLLYLKHKLKTLRPGCRGAYPPARHGAPGKLGQETQARISLEALKADSVAQLVAHKWAGVDSTEAPEEPPDVSWVKVRCTTFSPRRSCVPRLWEEAYRQPSALQL